MMVGSHTRTSKPKLAVSEHREQKAVIDWWKVYSTSRGLDERLLFSIPNGSHLAGNIVQRSKQMNKLKGEGFRPGVPDLMLAIPKRDLHYRVGQMLFAGLFCEMKRKGGKPSTSQVQMIDLLRQHGYNCVIAQGADEAIRAIKGYLG